MQTISHRALESRTGSMTSPEGVGNRRTLADRNVDASQYSRSDDDIPLVHPLRRRGSASDSAEALPRDLRPGRPGSGPARRTTPVGRGVPDRRGHPRLHRRVGHPSKFGGGGDGSGDWAIEASVDGTPTIVGVIGLHTTRLAHRRTAIGYWIASPYEGRGFVTRAADSSPTTASPRGCAGSRSTLRTTTSGAERSPNARIRIRGRRPRGRMDPRAPLRPCDLRVTPTST